MLNPLMKLIISIDLLIMHEIASEIPKPSLKKGWEIFASRPLSLIITLVIAISLSIISFFLLLFPVITSFYYTISQSKREQYLIDLNNILQTIFVFLEGIKRYFFFSHGNKNYP